MPETRQLAIGNWRLAKPHAPQVSQLALRVAKGVNAPTQSSNFPGEQDEGLPRPASLAVGPRCSVEGLRNHRGFPRDETYGLRIQVRRAAASIAENIAEGCGREGDGEFHRFLQIAAGSASETDYELLLARDLGFIGPADSERVQGNLVRVKKMLRSLVQKVGADRQAANAAH